MDWKKPIEFRWTLLAVVVASLTVVLISEDWGNGFGPVGFQGIGYSRTAGGIEGYQLLVIPVGLAPAAGILVWQYLRGKGHRAE